MPRYEDAVLRCAAVTDQPHDALFKLAFETPADAAGVLRGALPPAVAEAIDWSTIRGEPGSFVGKELEGRHTDLLFSAVLGNERAFLYLLLEHQSTSDPDMPLRMLSYLVRIWEKFRKEHPRGSLPIVIPMVIAHARSGWSAPRSLAEMFNTRPASIAGLAELVPSFSLLVEDLAELSNAEIKALALRAFPTLALWALRDARSAARLVENLRHWGQAFSEAWAAPNGIEAVNKVLRYLSVVCQDLDLEEFRGIIREYAPEVEVAVMTIAEQMRNEGAAEGRAEGRAEGLAKGLLAGRIQVLAKQLVLKFGAIGAEHEALINAATDEDLDRYVERVLSAETLAAVFAE